MYIIINTAYGDFWFAIVIVILIFTSFIIWVLICSRKAVRENIDVVFKKNISEKDNSVFGEVRQ
jgi:cytoskeletal protein RodZ